MWYCRIGFLCKALFVCFIFEYIVIYICPLHVKLYHKYIVCIFNKIINFKIAYIFYPTEITGVPSHKQHHTREELKSSIGCFCIHVDSKQRSEALPFLIHFTFVFKSTRILTYSFSQLSCGRRHARTNMRHVIASQSQLSSPLCRMSSAIAIATRAGSTSLPL